MSERPLITEDLGNLYASFERIVRRTREGELDFDQVLEALQRINLGDFSEPCCFDTSPFVPPELQRQHAILWNAERAWGFTPEDFRALGDPPPHPSGDLQAVVLEIRLPDGDGMGGVERTFRELLGFAISMQVRGDINRKIGPDPAHLRLADGLTHAPGLRWRVIDFAAHWRGGGADADSVTDPKRMPELGLLSAMCHFPKWVSRMNGRQMPYAYLTGVRVQIGGHGMADHNHLRLEGGRRHGGFFIYPSWARPHSPAFAMPEYVGL